MLNLANYCLTSGSLYDYFWNDSECYHLLIVVDDDETDLASYYWKGRNTVSVFLQCTNLEVLAYYDF